MGSAELCSLGKLYDGGWPLFSGFGFGAMLLILPIPTQRPSTKTKCADRFKYV